MKNICVVLLLLVSWQAKAQFGLQASYIAPSGNLKYSLKPSVGAEIKFALGDIDKRFKLSGTFGFYSLKPTQDTFKIYGTQTGGTAANGIPVNGTLLQPGYEVVYNYRTLSIGICSDFKILDTKFSPTIGLDFYTYITTINEDYSVEGQVTVGGKYANTLSYNFSFVPKVGLSYEYKKKWLFTSGMARSMAFYGTDALRAYWKTYISAVYYFN